MALIFYCNYHGTKFLNEILKISDQKKLLEASKNTNTIKCPECGRTIYPCRKRK